MSEEHALVNCEEQGYGAEKQTRYNGFLLHGLDCLNQLFRSCVPCGSEVPSMLPASFNIVVLRR